MSPFAISSFIGLALILLTVVACVWMGHESNVPEPPAEQPETCRIEYVQIFEPERPADDSLLLDVLAIHEAWRDLDDKRIAQFVDATAADDGLWER